MCQHSTVVSGLAGRALPQGCLRGSEPRDRNPEWRAGDVVEAELVAERDRRRVAAVLAADADFELVARLAAALDADAHRLAHAFAIDRHERIGRKDAARRVGTEEARRVVAADAKS